jgi:transposase-like protein
MRLGAERTQLAGRLRNNTAKIDALLLRAVDVGIPIEHYSRMVGVSRQTLYRWRNALVSLRAARG